MAFCITGIKRDFTNNVACAEAMNKPADNSMQNIYECHQRKNLSAHQRLCSLKPAKCDLFDIGILIII